MAPSKWGMSNNHRWNASGHFILTTLVTLTNHLSRTTDDEEEDSDSGSPAPVVVNRKKFDDEEDDEDVNIHPSMQTHGQALLTPFSSRF